MGLYGTSPEPRHVRNGTRLDDVGSLTMKVSKVGPTRKYDEYEDLLNTIE